MRTIAGRFLVSLALLPMASPSPAAPDPVRCEDALHLPEDADEESVRITCSIPAEYRRDVTMAQIIGMAIRRHDIAAWLTTDVLRDAGLFKGWTARGEGWLTFEDDGDIRVRYYASMDDDIFAMAEATHRFDPWETVGVRKLAQVPADERETRLLSARRLASSQDQLRCTRAPYNTVIFEYEDEFGPQIFVAMMPPMEEHSFPFGGYEMYRITRDGSRIVDRFAQSATCLGGSPEDVREASYLPSTHLRSATPTMFHVFMSLQYRKPLLVVTTQNDLAWKVESGRIHLLDESMKEHALARSILAIDSPSDNVP